LISECDILVENYKVGDLKRYGLSYEDLHGAYPRLIYCSVTGYGQDGPYAHKPGYDFIFQGEGGLMSINGEVDDKPGGGPMKTSIAVTDVLTGLNAAVAILAAVENRHHTGQGQHIDISLLDTIVHFGSNQIVSYFSNGKIPRRWGNAHPNLTPYQSFKTADGHLIIACGNDGQFIKLCVALGCEHLSGDPRFLRMTDRNRHREELITVLSNMFLQQPTSHWLALLEHCEVPNGSINSYDKVFQHPQVVHRGLRITQQHIHGGTVSTVRNPIRLSDTPVEYRHPPPVRAQHTDEVLKEILGLDDRQLDDLKECKAVETAVIKHRMNQ
jgi:crotonobetainyl-CoA:carnitine CoA-transferase CaiB-like acyl-CoA transferase